MAEIPRVARNLLVLAGLGLRRGEVLGLHWRNVFLADPAGPRLRVSETIVRGRADTPKSEASERTLALGPRLASELFEHRARSANSGDGELVFCHRDNGTVFDHKRYAETLKAALAKARIVRKVRPSTITDKRRSRTRPRPGTRPRRSRRRAGHADFSTTQRNLHLADVVFRDRPRTRPRRGRRR